MKNLAILGSTGSIGKNTLEIVRQFPERFNVVALGAGKNVELLSKQVAEFKPQAVCVLNREIAEQLEKIIGKHADVEIYWGKEGYKRLAYMDYERGKDGIKIKVVDVNRDIRKKWQEKENALMKGAKVSSGRGEIVAGGKTYKVPSSNLNSRRQQATCLNCGSLIRFVDEEGSHYTEKKEVAKDEMNELELYVKWALKKYHQGDEGYARQRLLVKVNNIAMPNLIAGKEIVPEFIQNDANEDNIAREAIDILSSPERYIRISGELLRLRDRLNCDRDVSDLARIALDMIG